MKTEILIVAVNARYSHSSFAALSLLANLGDFQKKAGILEEELEATPLQLASEIAAREPAAIAFCAYLWNIRLMENTARILRAVLPHTRLFIGGPEITRGYPNADLFDTVIVGEGETAFRAALAAPAADKWVFAEPEDTAALTLPYSLYTQDDLAHRIIYVESSRGCPFGCAYCTSAHTGLRLIPLTRLLPALERLLGLGLRQFKFLDRSFNAPSAHALSVLDFFLARLTSGLHLHFEINPEHIDPAVMRKLADFPPGVLHLEAGVQTLNPAVARAIGRTGEIETLLANLDFLLHHTGATVHADLIFGLPGEDEASFAKGFDTMVSRLDPPELQVNLLKGLPGTAFAQNAKRLGLVFNPEPPYEVLATDVLDFAALSRLQTFARCWELVHNRGKLPQATARLKAAASPFAAYAALSSRLLLAEGRLFAISLPRLTALVDEFLSRPGDSCPQP